MGRLGREVTMTVKMVLVVVIEMAEVDDICVELEGQQWLATVIFLERAVATVIMVTLLGWW